MVGILPLWPSRSQFVCRAADSSTASIQNVRINHCSVYVAVPEQLLNRANIVAILKSVRYNAFKSFDSSELFESLDQLSGPFKLLAFYRAVLQITYKVAHHNREPPGRFHNTGKCTLAYIPLIKRHIKLRTDLST